MANKFVSGTLILALAGFIVKAVGSVNWIILSRILGGEGIGIYQMAFPVYLLAQEVSGAGIPVALSVLTAEFAARRDFGNVYRLFRLALTVLAITGAILGLLVFFGSSVLIDYHIIRDSRAYYSLVSLVPCIFFTTLLSGYRGYFQGWRQMVPTAVSQIVEQVVRVVAMIGLALWLFPLGTEMAAGGAGLGASVGSVAAFIVLVCFYHRFKKTAPSVQSDYVPVHAKKLLFRLAGLAIPVSLAGRASRSSSREASGCSSAHCTPRATSRRLCGGMRVAIPTAIPSEPFTKTLGKREGRMVGSWLRPS